jgi:type IV secretory pathway VirB10-like protein
MKRLAVWSLALLMAAPITALAESAATRSDMRMLQTEADLLEESLRMVPDTHPRAGEFARRERQIRADLERLSTQVERHRRAERAELGASEADVNRLRREMVALRTDIDASVGARARLAERDFELREGTQIQIRLEQGLSSRTARPEDRVSASIAESVRADGMIVIPAGTSVEGVVQSVEPARRPAHGGRLELSFDRMFTSDGRRIDVRTQVVDLKEESIDKSKAGLGALAGGVLGALLEGKEGAIIGALVGGGGAIVATKGDEVDLPAGAILTLRLDRPVFVRR